MQVTEETMRRIADALEKIADSIGDNDQPKPARARRSTPMPLPAPDETSDDALAETLPKLTVQLMRIPSLSDLGVGG